MKFAALKKYIPVLIIILLGLVVGWFIKPIALDRFTGELVNETTQLLADGQKIAYVDYDCDGYSEQFIYYHMSDNRQPVINQYSNQGDFQNVWFLDGEILDNFDFIVGDYNNDSIKEVYVFSIDQDGLYLYGLKAGKSNQFFPEKVRICQFDQSISTKHLVIRSGKIADLNNDGFGELIFSINSRFTESPRKIISYDIANETVQTSAELGMQLVGSPIIYDIDNDNYPEIFISTLNSTNQAWVGSSDKGLYSASVVLSSDLSYYFVPILYQSRMSVTSTFPYNYGGEKQIVSISWSLREKERPKLIMLNNKGEIISQKRLLNKSFIFDQNRNNWDKILLFNKTGGVNQFGPRLISEGSFQLNGASNQVRFIDIDNDGNLEFLAVHNDGIYIYRNNFTQAVKVEIPGLGVQKVALSVKKNGDKTNYLSVQNDNYQFLIKYGKNKRYWLNYVFYLGSILIILLIYGFIRRLYVNRVNAAKFKNEKFFEMQLDLIKSQLDPHFLFNALNSIAFSINKEDRKTAYSNLGQFSKFMRESIVSMDEFSRSLEEEMGYVKNYLTLEKFRFKEKFDYDFIISPEVNTSHIVPKLILFSFTESALKKSVLPCDCASRIVFTIDSIGDTGVYISITENGLHRHLETSNEGHTINMMLMNRIVDYFNSFNTNKIEINIKDNGTEEAPKGSTVEIIIPTDYKYII